MAQLRWRNPQMAPTRWQWLRFVGKGHLTSYNLVSLTVRVDNLLVDYGQLVFTPDEPSATSRTSTTGQESSPPKPRYWYRIFNEHLPDREKQAQCDRC